MTTPKSVLLKGNDLAVVNALVQEKIMHLQQEVSILMQLEKLQSRLNKSPEEE